MLSLFVIVDRHFYLPRCKIVWQNKNCINHFPNYVTHQAVDKITFEINNVVWNTHIITIITIQNI
jgi:hypothetical protein